MFELAHHVSMKPTFTTISTIEDDDSATCAYHAASVLINKVDPALPESRHHIENLRVFIELASGLSSFHRIDLALQLHAVAQVAQELKRR